MIKKLSLLFLTTIFFQFTTLVASAQESVFVGANVSPVSRRSGGEWITMRLNYPMSLSQLNFRVIGQGLVRIYAINLVRVSSNSAVEVSSTDINPLQIVPIYLDGRNLVSEVQVLAESFRANLSLGTDLYAFQQGYPGPTPGPGPQPPTNAPACEMFGSGAFNGSQWAYRGGYNGQVMFATDNINVMVQKFRELESVGLCTNQASLCGLAGNGAFNGLQWAYRMAIASNGAEKIFFATDNINQLLGAIDDLSQQRICRMNSAQRCDLAGPGAFNGLQWASRLSLGGKIVYASDNQSNVIAVIQQFKSRGVCN
jgi:hypothetical protein